MKIHTLDPRMGAALACSLDRFEQQFSYPLGQTQSFHVSHGDDYVRFFRAMGRAQCFIAEQDGKIIGSLAVVVRRIRLPDRSEKDVGYLGDLKISPCARGGRTLFQLARAAASWIQRSVTAYFGVVMDGTAATPDRYTGRAGLPLFEAIAKVVVVQFPTPDASSDHDPTAAEVDPNVAMACFRNLSIGRYATPCTNSFERSVLV